MTFFDYDSLVSSRFVPMDVSYPWTFRTQTIRTQSRTFRARTFRTHIRLVRTQPSGRFVPNKLSQLVKTIKMQRSHAQGICVNLFVILLNFT